MGVEIDHALLQIEWSALSPRDECACGSQEAAQELVPSVNEHSSGRCRRSNRAHLKRAATPESEATDE
jgi:hypothetical protein